MAAIRRFGQRIGWSVAALVVLAGLGVALATWYGPVKHRLVRWINPEYYRMADAAAAYQKGDWERAADLSRQSLKTAGNDPELLRIYARASARLERDATAGAIYQDRLGAARLQTEDYFLVGLGIARAGKLPLALEVWNKAARNGPDHPELLDNLSRLSARLKRLDEAAEAAGKLARQSGWEARGFLLLGEIQGLLENPQGAVDAVNTGLELDPSAKGAPFTPDHYRKLLAQSLLQLGRTDEAVESLEAVFATTKRADPDPEANWLLSRAYLRQGRAPDASAALRRAGSFRDDNPLRPEPSPYVGAARCAACHPKETRSHARTRHARTFHHGPGLLTLPLPDRPLADPDAPKVTHAFEREGGRIHIKTKAGDHVFDTIVEFAFGVRDRYVTMIGRDDKNTYRALRLSSYHTAEGLAWGRTSGDVPDSDSVENVRGEPIGVRDGVVRCLYCHVTQSRDFRDPPPVTGVGPAATDAGIGCERCHGPGGNHLAAIKVDFPDRAIVNAGTASASAILMECADCHIVGIASEIRDAADDPKYVRSPGVTLAVSRCYTESEGKMSCLTCHDPHRDDVEPASFFEARCLGCHSPKTASQKSCRVNPTKDCLNCHMPKVPVAALHTTLTDHYIRVRREK
jgi:tetratricopeptide (TPR) repeat protein